MVGRLAFAVPGDLDTPTGGYAYDRRMITELRSTGWRVDVIDLGDGFPFPGAAQRGQAEARLLAVPHGWPIVVDGLAFGVIPDMAARLREHHPLLALVHHPLAMESGLGAKDAEALRASERAALAAAHRVIVTSPATARLLAETYGVPPERTTVACPGSDPVPQAQGSRDGIVRLLAVGSVVPRKGYDVLVAALTQLADRPWRLTIAGDRTRDAACAAQLDAEIARHRLGDRIALLGAVPEPRLPALYRAADVFVLASRLEGYGMALAAAVAHGVPVVTTRAGAIPDTVAAAAALFVAPDDVDALAEALRRMIEDSDLRARLAAAARDAARRLPTWKDSAASFARAVEAAA